MSLLAMVEERLRCHHCKMCNRPLTDPESIKLGMGPICRQKYDLHFPLGHTEFIEIEREFSAYWATYIFNGDESSLQEGEKEIIDEAIADLGWPWSITEENCYGYATYVFLKTEHVKTGV